MNAALVTAAQFERDRRRDTYPQRIAAGGDAEKLCLDYQCWVAIAEWIETERFLTFAGGADPDSEGAPIVRFANLEAAAARGLKHLQAKAEAAEPDAEIHARLAAVMAIHRAVALRATSIAAINAELRQLRTPQAA
jgi:hypothetical protein